ncbi:MAG: hypothetical protein FJ014_13300 [Chloroflexi bacterium]|nr:hypothetical protein [Chloroflexota bacterium]
MERLELIERLTYIFDGPPAYVEPIERCGCIVTVSTEPAHHRGDPYLPIPLVELPARFWGSYQQWFQALKRYLDYQPNPFGGTVNKRGQLCTVARQYGEGLANELRLSTAENRYFRLRITAALMGDTAE